MRSRQWYSHTAKMLMRVTGLPDAAEAMVQRVEALLNEVEANEPPIDLRMVASFQRVKQIQPMVMSQAGRLVPDGHDFIIQVNAQHSIGKQNFTIGHEIGHTLLPSYQVRPHVVEDIATGVYQRGQEEEYLCDVAAAELLMPMPLFKPLAAARGLNLNTLRELAQIFHSSREATARRLTQTNIWPCAFALWQYAYKPSQEPLAGQPTFDGLEWVAPSKELRVRYSIPSSSFGYRLYPHLAAPPDGILAQCFSEGMVVEGTEELELQGRIIPLYVMAVPVNFVSESGPVREVLSLVRSDKVPIREAENQLNLWTTI